MCVQLYRGIACLSNMDSQGIPSFNPQVQRVYSLTYIYQFLSISKSLDIEITAQNNLFSKIKTWISSSFFIRQSL